MKKKLWIWAVVGALVGAAVVQTAHVIGDRNSRELFSQRLRCKALADKYVKEHSGTLVGTVVVSRVEFSRKRSSCIVSTFEQLGPDASTAKQLGLTQQPADQTYTLKVVDLLTGEDLITRYCTGNAECAENLPKRDEAFEESR
jgi:hypothetical protein